MKYLYLDNIRGFDKELIPLKDVNFLVGENSTGKTSLIALLNLISSMNFWFTQEFNTEEYKFGNYEDIVSINSSKRNHFYIGLIEEIKEEKQTTLNSFLIKFIEKDGLPIVSMFATYQNNQEMRIKFFDKYISYKIDKFSEKLSINSFVKDIFTGWIKNKDNGYKIIKKGILFDRRQALVEAIPFISLYNKSNKEDTKQAQSKNLYKMIRPLPSFFNKVAWLAPVRTSPKRTYDNIVREFKSGGDHIPFVIKKFFDKKEKSVEFYKFIEKFGKDSGLFDTIEIKNFSKANTPFELDIIIQGKSLNICNVGYGVSQALPIVVESFIRENNTYFAFQQPEVHLHPKAQAALGDLFFHLNVNDNKVFFIETHSDYLIDRFRLNYRKQLKNKPDSQILFFERTDKGNKIHTLEIDEKGKLPEDIPAKYKEFFINEELDILSI